MSLRHEDIQWTERNLRQSFKPYRQEMMIDDVEKRMGSNFANIMREVYKMSDTLGLCGILAVHASSILTDGKGKEIVYSPREYKRMFDVALKSGTARAYDVFQKKALSKSNF